MAPAPEYLPLAFIHLARAYDAELGSPERGDERPGEPNSQVVPFSGRPIMKDLKPRIKNLTPWPYVAIAVIALILLFVLGYALSNCYRKMKLRNGAPKPRYLNLSLLQRSVMAGKPSTGVKRKFAWSGPPKVFQAARLEESPSNFSKKDLPLSRSTSKSTVGLENSIALPSSCYIPYTPTSLSLAHRDDSALLGTGTLSKQDGKKNTRRSRTKSVIEALKRKTRL